MKKIYKGIKRPSLFDGFVEEGKKREDYDGNNNPTKEIYYASPFAKYPHKLGRHKK